MATITLSGYYGYGNAGDEAVLTGLVRSLRAQSPADNLEIVVLSGRPEETASAQSVRAADRYRPKELMRALARTDLLLSGGGSLLQDVTSAHSIFYYLGVVRAAQLLGKKTMFVAQGIGPLLRPRTRRLVAAVANRLSALTVRDSASADLLREIGVKKVPVEVTADPALLLGKEKAEALENKVGVSLRPWQSYGGRLAEAVAHASYTAFPSAQLSSICMQPKSDHALMEHFTRIWHQQGGGSVEQMTPGPPDSLFVPLEPLLDQLAACDMVIGMRLHALILAAACAIPAVALSYDPKVAAFMAQCGQADAVYDLKTETPDLAHLLRRVWAQRHERTAALRECVPHLRAAAARNAEIALRLLSDS